MITYLDAYISVNSLHFVGNKIADEGILLSKNPIVIDHKLEQKLLSYFLPPFTSEEFYQFHHESDLALNEVYTYASKIFDNKE